MKLSDAHLLGAMAYVNAQTNFKTRIELDPPGAMVGLAVALMSLGCADGEVIVEEAERLAGDDACQRMTSVLGDLTGTDASRHLWYREPDGSYRLHV